MTIETERLLLCRMSVKDADQILTIFTDPRVMASFDDQLFDRTMMDRSGHPYWVYAVSAQET